MNAVQVFNDSQRTLRILLAEDDETLRRLLVVVLRADGHEVVEARDGVELLEALAASLTGPPESAFDAIVSEHGLPGIRGLAVLAGMRARGHSVRFVLLTADPDVQLAARRLHAVTLSRPLEGPEIRAALVLAAAAP
jgi:two-component system response regulator (stage 0 sporulation protein F)